MVRIRKGVYEGQTSVFYPWKDGKVLSDGLLSVFADNIGAYMVTKFVKEGVIHLCIEWA